MEVETVAELSRTVVKLAEMLDKIATSVDELRSESKAFKADLSEPMGFTQWKEPLGGRTLGRKKRRSAAAARSDSDDSDVESDDNDRRMSVFRKELTAKVKSTTGARYVATVPDHSKIYLSSLTVKAAIGFFKAVNKYHRTYKPLKLPVSSMISPSVINLLVSFFRRKGVTEHNFHELEPEEILDLVQLYVQPRSRTEFRDELKTNLQFMWDKGQILLSNTPEFCEAVLQFTQQFFIYVDFMGERNEANTPRCDDKEGGLLKIFFSKFPNGYGRSVLTEMEAKSFNSFSDFTKVFYPHVEATASLMRSSAMEMRRFGVQMSTSTKPAKFVSAAVPGGTSSNGERSKALHSLQEESMQLSELQIEEVSESFNVASETDESDKAIQVLQASRTTTDGSRPAQKEPVPCYTLILYGACNRDRCNFSHDTTICQQGHVKMCLLLKESKFATSKSLLQPATVNALLNNVANSSRKRMRVNGNLYVGNEVMSVRILLDTGASHSSYISKHYVDKHSEIWNGIIEKVDGETVVLGDSVTTIPIHGKLAVPLELISDDMRTDSYMVTFSVIEHSSNDIVLGLPDIARCFATFFLNEFHQCVEEFTELGVLPFPGTIEGVAPEEESSPVPCSFENALYFLERSHEEAMNEFEAAIDKQVAPEFLANTHVRKLLLDWGHKAFIPENWNGIQGVPELELQWRADMPDNMSSSVRYINPAILEDAEKEFKRMRGYFYEPSTSAITSPLVIAPKATKPFIRICGDYREPNKYVVPAHDPIPIPRKELEKAAGFKIYLDIDMTNSFHQIRLGPVTSNHLTVKTKWGLFKPKFLPEGVGPASPTLQRVVRTIFADFDPFVIAVFDNILVLAMSYEDAYEKLQLILQRCIDRNLYLKFSKSFLGFKEVKFFGYIVNSEGISLSGDRLTGIDSMKFPTTKKRMQSFLGMANYFHPFVEKFSELASPLFAMTKKEFIWDQSKWDVDYKECFDRFKEALRGHFMLYYPNYELDWILRTDASQIGVGAVLYMVRPVEGGKAKQLLPIACLSKKFSEQASRWTTIEQECYGIYHAVHSLADLLLGKVFIIETDHNNLLWMSKSEVAKIIRWRIYLQGFSFMIKHIPRSQNEAADHFSKAFALLENFCEIDKIDRNENNTRLTPVELFRLVHGGRRGHVGASRTMNRLNVEYPGHGISMEVVRDFVRECPTCQKDRLGLVDVLPGVIRHLKVPHLMDSIGVDILSISPTDKIGNCAIVVVVVLFSKYTWLYPIADYSADTLARALFKFYATFGLFERIHSDPGSNLTAMVTARLHEWFGIKQIFSLVDRHESNGVERTNKEIARHLRALVADERVKDNWSSDTVLPIIAYLINSEVHSETGYTPLEMHFGSKVALMQLLPDAEDSRKYHDGILKELNSNLEILRETSYKYQMSMVEKRTKMKQPQNLYQPRDLILFHSGERRNKLDNIFLGPYEVIAQEKNDVECKHLVSGIVKIFHVDRVKPFHGSYEEAFNMALLDDDQHVIDAILAYRGDVDVRTTLEFETRFADGTVVWLPWSKDLFDSLPYEDFCNRNPQLRSILYTVKESKQWATTLNKLPIDGVAPGDIVYVNLRSWGELWYQDLNIPDPLHTLYVVPARYSRWGNARRTKVWIEFPDFDDPYIVDHLFVVKYGMTKTIPENAYVVDASLVAKYPEIRQSKVVVK